MSSFTSHRIKRALLLSSSSVAQMVTVSILQRLGFHVTAVEHTHLALSALQTHNFALVLIDQDNSKLDPLAVATELRMAQNSKDQHYLLIVISNEQGKETFLAAGIDDCVSSPVKFAAMEDALLRWGYKKPDTIAELRRVRDSLALQKQNLKLQAGKILKQQNDVSLQMKRLNDSETNKNPASEKRRLENWSHLLEQKDWLLKNRLHFLQRRENSFANDVNDSKASRRLFLACHSKNIEYFKNAFKGHQVCCITEANRVAEVLNNGKFDLHIIDIQFDDWNSIEIVNQIREIDRQSPIIMISTTSGFSNDYIKTSLTVMRNAKMIDDFIALDDGNSSEHLHQVIRLRDKRAENKNSS